MLKFSEGSPKQVPEETNPITQIPEDKDIMQFLKNSFERTEHRRKYAPVDEQRREEFLVFVEQAKQYRSEFGGMLEIDVTRVEGTVTYTAKHIISVSEDSDHGFWGNAFLKYFFEITTTDDGFVSIAIYDSFCLDEIE